MHACTKNSAISYYELKFQISERSKLFVAEIFRKITLMFVINLERDMQYISLKYNREYNRVSYKGQETDNNIP